MQRHRAARGKAAYAYGGHGHRCGGRKRRLRGHRDRPLVTRAVDGWSERCGRPDVSIEEPRGHGGALVCPAGLLLQALLFAPSKQGTQVKFNAQPSWHSVARSCGRRGPPAGRANITSCWPCSPSAGTMLPGVPPFSLTRIIAPFHLRVNGERRRFGERRRLSEHIFFFAHPALVLRGRVFKPVSGACGSWGCKERFSDQRACRSDKGGKESRAHQVVLRAFRQAWTPVQLSGNLKCVWRNQGVAAQRRRPKESHRSTRGKYLH